MSSKFRDAGTYVRDDSLYSYDGVEKDSNKPDEDKSAKSHLE